tara:strand:+ start:420 stop:1007 length:588 start_codon:yes stop_codon:yes gene_type:complete
MKELENLESMLEDAGVFSLDDEGNRIITDSVSAHEAYFEYVSGNSGFINRWINNVYRNYLKGRANIGPVGTFLQAYIGGCMTRSDQEVFAQIAEDDPWRLTVKNALIDIVFSPQYYLLLQGTGMAASFVTEHAPEHVNEIGYGLTSFIITANVIRMGLAAKLKKAYASISLEGLVINTPTYIKRLNNKLFGTSEK